MSYDPEDSIDSTSNPRREKRRLEDRKRMAYRRAIEDYRESRALHQLVCDYPDLSNLHRSGTWL